MESSSSFSHRSTSCIRSSLCNGTGEANITTLLNILKIKVEETDKTSVVLDLFHNTLTRLFKYQSRMNPCEPQ